MADKHTAHELSQELNTTANGKSRLDENRSIVLTMVEGKRPDVEFGGFWNGHLIKAALNSISKAYRVRRYKKKRPHAGVKKEEGDAR